MRGVKGHVRSGARWVHPPNRSPIRQNSPIFGCFCSMGLHFGGSTRASSLLLGDQSALDGRLLLEWAILGR